MTEMILKWLEPALTTLLILVIGMGVTLLKRLPSVLRTTLDALEKEAAKTDTPLDDAAVSLLRVLVSAFQVGLDTHLPDKKTKK